MSLFPRTIALASVVVRGASSSNQGETPVAKVVQLLQRIEKQVGQEGKEEAQEYDKFACFCKEQASDKLYGIEKSKKVIKELGAEIESLDATITLLNSDIQELAQRIGEVEGQVTEAEQGRKVEQEDYESGADELKSAIEACTNALDEIAGSKEKLEGDVGALLQQFALSASQNAGIWSKSSTRIEKVASLVQLDEPGAAQPYNYKSDDVKEILQSLRRDFKQELKDMDADEFEKKAKHEKHILNLANEKKFKEEEKSEKDALVAEKQERLATAESDRTEEEEAKALDDTFMEELTGQCEEKAKVWDQRSTTRAAEITALSQAIDAMKTGAGAYGSVKLAALAKAQAIVTKKPAATQTAPFAKALARAHEAAAAADAAAKPAAQPNARKAAASFLQLRSSDAGTADAAVDRVVALLDSSAARLKSSDLSKLAAVVEITAGAAGALDKVKDLITDLISKLEDEASAESESKDFCSNGIEAAMATRDDSSIAIEDKEADIARKGAESKQLKAEINEIMMDLSELQKSISEAQELREEEKAQNARTISESTEGKEATETALSVLKDFYGGAAALLQRSRSPGGRDGKSLEDLAPKTSFDGDYEGKKGQSEGVIGLIETILDDFVNTIESTEQDETDAQAAYEDMHKETLESIDANSVDRDEKEKKITENTEAITVLKDEVAESKSLREGALVELEKLKAMCVEGAASFEERRKKREDEIQALKDAKDMLDKFSSS